MRRSQSGQQAVASPPPNMVQMASNPTRLPRYFAARTRPTSATGSDAIMEEKGIFDGLKVLDCASFIAAPAAATVLSDFGADVIKIEPPGAGDPYRNLPNLPGYPHSEHNFAWMLEGRNKKSLALDLSKPEGQAVLHKLAAEADVFITNYPPQVRARLGITYDHLAPTQRAADLCFLHRLWRKGRGGQQARLRQQRLLGALRPDGPRARRRSTPRRRARSPGWATIPAPWRFTARSSPRSTSASAPARARMSPPI